MCFTTIVYYGLQLLMCGTGNYSIVDLKDHHIVSGSTPQFFKVSVNILIEFFPELPTY